MSSLAWTTDSQTFERVGRIEIGLKLILSFFEPLLLYIAEIWAIFQISGNCPISKRLLNNLESEDDIWVDMSCKNFPEIPQWDEWDFFNPLMNFPNSNGEVFMFYKFATLCNFWRYGGSSSWPWTEDFEAKNELNISLFCFGSLIVSPPSMRGGVGENLLFFMSFCRMSKDFLAGIEKLFMVELTELKNANFARLLAKVDWFAAFLDFENALFFFV